MLDSQLQSMRYKRTALRISSREKATLNGGSRDKYLI